MTQRWCDRRCRPGTGQRWTACLVEGGGSASRVPASDADRGRRVFCVNAASPRQQAQGRRPRHGLVPPRRGEPALARASAAHHVFEDYARSCSRSRGPRRATSGAASRAARLCMRCCTTLHDPGHRGSARAGRASCTPAFRQGHFGPAGGLPRPKILPGARRGVPPAGCRGSIARSSGATPPCRGRHRPAPGHATRASAPAWVRCAGAARNSARTRAGPELFRNRRPGRGESRNGVARTDPVALAALRATLLVGNARRYGGSPPEVVEPPPVRGSLAVAPASRSSAAGPARGRTGR